MSRIILERLTLFAVPFIVYGAYLLLQQMRPPVPDRSHPWTLLSIAGLVLFALSFIVWGITAGDPTTGTYVAPHMDHGKVVPGYVAPSEHKP